MIGSSIAFLVGGGQARDLRRRALLRRVARRRATTRCDCLRAAADAGAETLVLCDTNGSSLPPQIAEATRAAVAEFGDRCRIGIHPHNDAGCGVANALVAVEAGALQVQGTTNGVGERTGNANLTTIIANLALKMGHEVLSLRPARRSSPRRRTSSTSCSTARPTRASRTSASSPSPTRAACTSRACARTPRRSSTWTRRWSATSATC